MESKRRLEPEIGKEPVRYFSLAELDDMITRLDLAGLGGDPIIEGLTFQEIDKLLNGPVN